MSDAVSCRQPSVLRRDSKMCTDISVQHFSLCIVSFYSIIEKNIHFLFVIDGGYSKIGKTLSFNLFSEEAEKTGE